jgi:predicted TIM-barrel fold metal-dependent hydrolase
MTTLDYGIIDCDTHCYETRDAFTRYLPKEFMDRAITPVRNAGGQEVILAGGRVATFNSEQGLGFDYAYRPGTLREMLRQMASGNPDETYRPEPMRVEYQQRGPRLTLMRQQGVESAVLFPAMALAAEHYVNDTPALYANIHSFNRWYDETWGFNFENKIFATALLSLRDLDSAVAETEAVIERGARVVLLPTGPAYGRSPADPYFDPVWSRLNEAKVIVAFHIMPYWYFDALSPAWGHNPDPASVFDNLFGRFPDLMVLVAEHGASWVPHFVSSMDKSRGMGRNGPWIGGKLTERPSEIFARHVRVAPYPEEKIGDLVTALGGDQSIVMGSDFPHAEGIAEPVDFLKILDGLGQDVQRRIMRDNAEALFQC